MFARIIFVLFTIAFITYTWFHTSKAKSCHAVNEVKGTCKCEAIYIQTTKEGNKNIQEARDSFQACEDDCIERNAVFCSDCEGNSEAEKREKCPGSSLFYPGCKKEKCGCEWSTAVN